MNLIANCIALDKRIIGGVVAGLAAVRVLGVLLDNSIRSIEFLFFSISLSSPRRASTTASPVRIYKFSPGRFRRSIIARRSLNCLGADV